MANKDNIPEEKEPLTLIEEVELMAACNYTPTEMALYLNYDKKAFKRQLEQEGTKINEAYRRGKLKSEFQISLQQKALAEAGNITAVQVFEKIRERKDTEILRNKIWFNE